MDPTELTYRALWLKTIEAGEWIQSTAEVTCICPDDTNYLHITNYCLLLSVGGKVCLLFGRRTRIGRIRKSRTRKSI